MKSLENQAKKAEKYYEIKKEYRELSIELAKASLEGFNITYRELNEQTETETNHKLQLESAIALEEAALEKNKLAFIEKEKALQTKQHSFNELVQQLRSSENDKNLASQRLDFLQEKESSLQEFLAKTRVQLTHLQENISFTDKQAKEEAVKLKDLQKVLDEKKPFARKSAMCLTKNEMLLMDYGQKISAPSGCSLKLKRNVPWPIHLF